MDDPETTAAWARQEPQKTIIACLEQLQDRGFTADELSESLLALHLTMAKEMYGPWPVADEANRADQAGRGTNGQY